MAGAPLGLSSPDSPGRESEERGRGQVATVAGCAQRDPGSLRAPC